MKTWVRERFGGISNGKITLTAPRGRHDDALICLQGAHVMNAYWCGWRDGRGRAVPSLIGLPQAGSSVPCLPTLPSSRSSTEQVATSCASPPFPPPPPPALPSLVCLLSTEQLHKLTRHVSAPGDISTSRPSMLFFIQPLAFPLMSVLFQETMPGSSSMVRIEAPSPACHH